MTEREHWGLRGPVRSCKLQRTWYSRCCGTDACETGERHDTTVVEFREDGRLISHWHQNPDGSEWKSFCEYEAQYRVADVLPSQVLAKMTPAQLDAVRALLGVKGEPLRRRHRYDARGRRIETHGSMFGPLGQDRRTMAYNEHGDQIEEISENESRECDINDAGELIERLDTKRVSRSEARFQYDYDVRGNWVRKVVEGRSGTDQDFSVSIIEQRALTYYS